MHVDAAGGDDVAEAVSDCQANVLVVLHQAFDLDGLPRRGPPSVVRGSSKWSIYKGPRRALIHGLLFGVPSLDQLRDGFAPWGALVREPSDAALAWISPAQLALTLPEERPEAGNDSSSDKGQSKADPEPVAADAPTVISTWGIRPCAEKPLQ